MKRIKYNALLWSFLVGIVFGFFIIIILNSESAMLLAIEAALFFMFVLRYGSLKNIAYFLTNALAMFIVLDYSFVLFVVLCFVQGFILARIVFNDDDDQDNYRVMFGYIQKIMVPVAYRTLS